MPVMTVSFAALELGDIIAGVGSPAGHSVRALGRVDDPLSSISEFAVLGELDMVLTTGPANVEGFVNAYRPVPGFPADPAACRQEAVGAVRFWPAHAPCVPDMMGELLWRIVSVRGRTQPLLLLYRSGEMVPFVFERTVPASELLVRQMQRLADDAHYSDVHRVSGQVRLLPGGPFVHDRATGVPSENASSGSRVRTLA